MNEDKGLSPLGAEMLAGLSAFCETLESGVPIETRYTVRTVRLDLQTKPYGPDDVRHVRRSLLKTSQTLFAQFLGVSVKALRSWEQGKRPVPAIACRFMDEIVANPDLWTRRLQSAVSTDRGTPIPS